MGAVTVMSVTLRLANPTDQGTVENLLQLYFYDYHQTICDDPGELMDQQGYYNLGYPLAPYLAPGATDRWAHLIMVDDRLAGFALINTRLIHHDPPGRFIDEFFVHGCYRRQGVGTDAARAVLDEYRGRWEICTMARNQRAVAFWETFVSGYTRDTYETFKENHQGRDFLWWTFDSSTH